VLPGAPDGSTLQDGPIEELTSQQRAAFLAGDAEFGQFFSAAEGLGPIFVAQSCSSCHVGDGKGHPAFNLTRFGRMEGGSFDPMRYAGGPQLQHRAILRYMAEAVPAGVTGVAQFTAPSVTGLGYLEAVEDSVLVSLADPEDRDGDGISGRLQLLDPSDFLVELRRLELLFDPDESARHLLVDGRYIGRFGRKASAINLLHQTVTAYREDMGLTSDLIPEDPINPQVGNFGADQVPDPEISSSTVSSVVFYLKTLRAPPRRNAEAPEVTAGEALFLAARCSALPDRGAGSPDLPSLYRSPAARHGARVGRRLHRGQRAHRGMENPAALGNRAGRSVAGWRFVLPARWPGPVAARRDRAARRGGRRQPGSVPPA
jgi:hypothetical protein